MVVKMMRWRPWPPIQTRKFQVKLVVKSIHGVKIGSLVKDGVKVAPLAVEVRWKGRPRTPLSPLRRSVRRNCTRGVEVVEGIEVVEWNEEFYCVCNLVGHKDGPFHPWEIALAVFHASDDGAKNKISMLGTTSSNLAEYALGAQEKEIEISIPFLMPGATDESALLFKLAVKFSELKTTEETSEMIPKMVSLVSLTVTNEDVNFSDKDEIPAANAKLKKAKTMNGLTAYGKPKRHGHKGRLSLRGDGAENLYPLDTDSLDDDPDDGEWEDDKGNLGVEACRYGTLATANCIGGSHYSEMAKNVNYDDWVYYSHRRTDTDVSLIEEAAIAAPDLSLSSYTLKNILPWKKRRMSFKSPKCKGEPLLKGYGEEGGDDIDFDRRVLSSSDESPAGEAPENNMAISKFGDDDFAVGKWEKREILSRNGQLKLSTEIFFASIDQRSERAAGESACTALVAVIAHWIQTNPDIMPTQSEFDCLIHEGSSEWRNLCCNDSYREQFPDKHFDLETVLQAKVRPLSVVPDRSFVGFFHPDGVSHDNTRFEFLNGSLSFEDIWDEITQVGSQSCSDGTTNLYIVSWNDHFFILKVEPEAYYLIDTLGERLFEGCKQAYVLKFDKDTEIQRVIDDRNNSSGKENGSTDETSKAENQQEEQNAVEEPQVQVNVKTTEDGDCLCKGKESCKEYIKSFLAALPIRELLDDLKRGLMASTPLHQVLQVDFHYTELSKQIIPSPMQSNTDELIMDSTLVEPPAA